MTDKTILTKKDLVDSIAGAANLSKADATRAHDALFATLRVAMAEGKAAQVIGFGTFQIKARSEREGRNPSTGEAMTIPASNGVKFKQAKALKDAVIQKDNEFPFRVVAQGVVAGAY